jgi:tetratricopeptide (TPR) repeat protein
LGHHEKALVEYREAIRLNPGLPVLHTANGLVLTELGRFDEALAEFTNTMRLDPSSPVPHVRMGDVLLKQGRDAEAIGQFRDALQIAPDDFTILARTAHVLASIENPDVRDGKNALVLATKANALTGGQQPFVLDILGMADAEAGDFTDAIEEAQKALDLANTAGLKNTAMRQRLQLYKNHQPWRESFLATNAPAKN